MIFHINTYNSYYCLIVTLLLLVPCFSRITIYILYIFDSVVGKKEAVVGSSFVTGVCCRCFKFFSDLIVFTAPVSGSVVGSLVVVARVSGSVIGSLVVVALVSGSVVGSLVFVALVCGSVVGSLVDVALVCGSVAGSLVVVALVLGSVSV